ncbi:alkane 1-monooxygenase [Gammaproteobacteria bacterium 45_16_T64]|nr:alkane 1-monooxygenase [Gammaproteobacteria bacterium 45_16_T64]
MFHYLKYTLFHFLTVPLMIGFTLGGSGLYLGFICAAGIVVLGDILLGDDESTPKFNKSGLLTIQLWTSLPLILFMNFLLMWVVADGDPLGYGALIQSLTGFDALAAKATNTIPGIIGAVLGCSLLSAIVGTIVGHELTHRTWDPVSLLIGRWLLAFSWDTGFSIEHVYGHHTYVGSVEDPATAPRGRNVYQHILISTYTGNVSAASIEAKRLQKKRQGVWSLHNRYIRGLLMSAVLEVAAFALAGWEGVAIFTISALVTKSMLEMVNFMEHYGIVRHPKSPVQPYHSWNSNKRISSWGTFNLTRHSHHHAEGDVPFHELKPYAEAPMMVNGLLGTMFLTLVPPLWNKIMVSKVLEWDQKYASQEELILADEANQRSGIKAFQAVSYTNTLKTAA